MNDEIRSYPVPGPIVLFGSGETSPAGQKIFDQVFRRIPAAPQVTILETPAGFELNSPQVAGRIGDFLKEHLKNYNPQVTVVPARRRDTRFSPDDPAVAAPLWQADLIFMGPGSPTYAVRQLRGSYTWDLLTARHRLGTSLAFASAATVAISETALPVYEIYKVGEDPHWKTGLDLFAPFGLRLVFIPHWNNNDGGNELDTSRCFMGLARFERLREMLPDEVTIVGLDERSGLLMDFAARHCQVLGASGITLIQQRRVKTVRKGHRFPLDELGNFHMPEPGAGLAPGIWEQALDIAGKVHQGEMEQQEVSQPPREVLHLVKDRQAARQRKDWQSADEIRSQIEALGWQVMDTPNGPQIKPAGSEGV